MNLKSSINQQGKTVTQIITFKGGYKKTIPGIKSESIVQSEFTHFETEDGRLVLVNTPNVLMVEVFKEEIDQKKEITNTCTRKLGHIFGLAPGEYEYRCIYCRQLK